MKKLPTLGAFIFFAILGGFSNCTLFPSKNSIPNYFSQRSELVLVYIGSSSCVAANDESIPTLFLKLAHKIDSIAVEQNYGFTTIGISSEINIEEGLSHLKKIHNFDEISIGNGLANVGFQNYYWEKINPQKKLTIPQFIITKREYDYKSTQGLNESISPKINSEEVIVQTTGALGLYMILQKKHIDRVWDKL
ncbi:MAG: hypothetical protein FH748_05445 [Balneolaceae bacterium]|nr:hypothetical protein [Balneolaceae bacterium]